MRQLSRAGRNHLGLPDDNQAVRARHHTAAGQVHQRQVGPGIQTRIPFVDTILVVDIREKVREFKAERMLTKDNNVPVTINRRNPALQDNRRACPRRDTERRKFQRNNPASGSDNAEKQHRLVGVSGHIYCPRGKRSSSTSSRL